MGPDELADFEERTFRQWDRASLGDLRRAIPGAGARTRRINKRPAGEAGRCETLASEGLSDGLRRALADT